MQIRKATEQDFEAYIKASEATCYSMELKGSPKQNVVKANCLVFFAKDQEKKVFCDFVKKEKIILLEDNGEVIAFAAIRQENRVCKILDFFVVTNHQGKGIGTFFVKSIIKEAKKKRIKRILLYCEFKGAMEFWKKMGFKEIPNGDFERKGNFEKIL